MLCILYHVCYVLLSFVIHFWSQLSFLYFSMFVMFYLGYDGLIVNELTLKMGQLFLQAHNTIQTYNRLECLNVSVAVKRLQTLSSLHPFASPVKQVRLLLVQFLGEPPKVFFWENLEFCPNRVFPPPPPRRLGLVLKILPQQKLRSGRF